MTIFSGHPVVSGRLVMRQCNFGADAYAVLVEDHAVLHYKVQDHFGLDAEDISKTKFKQFHFFRIWFVLQRYKEFGFKPFMTNMEATVDIVGVRNETKI